MYYSKIQDLHNDFLDDEALIVFVPDMEAYKVDEYIEYLKSKHIKFLGGVFPYVLSNGRRYNTGVVIKKIKAVNDILLFDMNTEIPTNSFGDIPKIKDKTLLVLVDGLSTHITGFINQVFTELTTNVKYIGGGAGYIDYSRKPCIFTQEGMFMNHAATVVIDSNIELQLGTGWDKLTGPFIVNSAHENTILQINWQPAFDIYKTILDKDSVVPIFKENFFDVAKQYPFGIDRLGDYYVVRDPIEVTDDNGIRCAFEVPEKSVIYVLKGSVENLINYASKLYSEVPFYYNGNKNILCFDCISRYLFLGDKFDELIAKYCSDADINFDGALTIGEISSYGNKGYLEFLNKTLVLGIIK